MKAERERDKYLWRNILVFFANLQGVVRKLDGYIKALRWTGIKPCTTCAVEVRVQNTGRRS